MPQKEEMNIEREPERVPNALVNIGGEDKRLPGRLRDEKEDVNPYDIFRLAKGILIVAASIYILLACVRIFYTGANTDGVKEVWEYSKVF